jgi:hypothetical protein
MTGSGGSRPDSMLEKEALMGTRMLGFRYMPGRTKQVDLGLDCSVRARGIVRRIDGIAIRKYPSCRSGFETVVR